MILPNTNISILNVRNALQYPSTDLGTLCSCNNINPYSMWKPVISSALTADYNVLKTANFGFGDYNSETDISNRRWVYKKPIGGINSPYRLGDFRNYNSDMEATNFIDINLPTNLLPQSLNMMNINAVWDETPTLLGIKSVYYDSEYWGIRLRSLTNNTTYFCTLKKPKGDFPLYLTDYALDWDAIGLSVELTQYISNRIIGATGDVYSGRWIKITGTPVGNLYPVIDASGQVIKKNYTLPYSPNEMGENNYYSLLTDNPYGITATGGATTNQYTFQIRDRASLGLSRLKSLTSTFVIQRAANIVTFDYPMSGDTTSNVYVSQAGTNLYDYKFFIPVNSRSEKTYLSIYLNEGTHTRVELLQRFEIAYI